MCEWASDRLVLPGMQRYIFLGTQHVVTNMVSSSLLWSCCLYQTEKCTLPSSDVICFDTVSCDNCALSINIDFPQKMYWLLNVYLALINNKLFKKGKSKRSGSRFFFFFLHFHTSQSSSCSACCEHTLASSSSPSSSSSFSFSSEKQNQNQTLPSNFNISHSVGRGRNQTEYSVFKSFGSWSRGGPEQDLQVWVLTVQVTG